MPYYKNKDLLFIHIPKTGGRVVEKQICKLYPQTLFSGRSNTILDSPYDKISLQHQFYTVLYKNRIKLDINFDKIKVFTIIRNPYDRIISDLLWYNLIKKDFSSEEVYEVIKNKYLIDNELDNHNEPQYKFITDENCNLIPNIKIFRTEKLNEANDELNKFLGFDIDIIQKNVNKDYSKYLNKDSIALINKVYKKDFELFNYNLKNTI